MITEMPFRLGMYPKDYFNPTPFTVDWMVQGKKPQPEVNKPFLGGVFRPTSPAKWVSD